MPRPSTQRSNSTRVRSLVEEHTPDGALGRLGLAAVAGPGAILSLFVAYGFLPAYTLVELLVVLTAPIAGVALALVTLLTLWPVYLSAVGRIETPARYSRELQDSPSSPTERLKREYRQGAISEDELERELETILDASGPTESTAEGSRRTADEQQLGEPERNT